jgi:hypothetical protein
MSRLFGQRTLNAQRSFKSAIPHHRRRNPGRTSAPRLPQAWRIKRGSRSDKRKSSGHVSPLIAIEWLQRQSAQYTSSPRTPASRKSAKVILIGRAAADMRHHCAEQSQREGTNAVRSA